MGDRITPNNRHLGSVRIPADGLAMVRFVVEYPSRILCLFSCEELSRDVCCNKDRGNGDSQYLLLMSVCGMESVVFPAVSP